MWNDADHLKWVSHGLMWCAVVFGILAAGATGIRYYVDRRVNELNTNSRNADAAAKDAAQKKSDAILHAKIEAADEREKNLRNQVEAAGRVQEKANSKLSDLEQKSRPRGFNSAQQEQFIREISTCINKKVLLTASLGDAESINFANHLDKLFKLAGWSSSVSQATSVGTLPTGMVFVIQSEKKLHPCNIALQKTFERLGISAPAYVDHNSDADVIRIRIFSKS